MPAPKDTPAGGPYRETGHPATPRSAASGARGPAQGIPPGPGKAAKAGKGTGKAATTGKGPAEPRRGAPTARKDLPGVTAADQARGQRILYAHLLLSQQLDRHVSLAEFGELVARAEGKDVPYSASSVSRWESGEAEPVSSTIRAIVKVCRGQVDPGWLMFGEDAKGTAPRKLELTVESVAAARASGRRKGRGA